MTPLYFWCDRIVALRALARTEGFLVAVFSWHKPSVLRTYQAKSINRFRSPNPGATLRYICLGTENQQAG